MKIQIILLMLLALLLYTVKLSLAADTYEGTFASASVSTQVTVSTNTPVLIYDTTRVHWNIHPEGTVAVRCTFGLSNGQVATTAPTTSIGEEMLGGGYFDNLPFTPPQLSMNCTAESSTVVVDIVSDYKY